MPRQVPQRYGIDPPKQSCLCKSKLDQPVELKNPLQFLERQSDAKLVVHWTRTEGQTGTHSPIKLLPPW
ncbi:hypothetical protein M5D96_000368 [Drosophila gunungcola]|uniref:Uncharacterized protein n=1 Tax=Drosophila gunungcola TaxID=103775 RepID=A0A9P9YW74_9MUSC|nr:hypothetical protein M5D96_000368 [Drosophila gunungcola]